MKGKKTLRLEYTILQNKKRRRNPSAFHECLLFFNWSDCRLNIKFKGKI